ncbi:hypothetical protein DdX_02300 [Ditylenchus destructor]|uniref:Uncharacterized protein n=1 Tax=Ditylenchus destructor TaxID=166010 RepID=A0AAD4NHE7_9BILA|nr:hypothetical protein DdX_02300 [Ditylenchus destructor]
MMNLTSILKQEYLSREMVQMAYSKLIHISSLSLKLNQVKEASVSVELSNTVYKSFLNCFSIQTLKKPHPLLLYSQTWVKLHPSLQSICLNTALSFVCTIFPL